MTIALYKDGLVKSIFLDNPLWSVCYVLLLMLVILGFTTNVERYTIVNVTDKSQIRLAFNSCLILFSGPVMCIQNWQMAEKLKSENKMKAHYLASLLFGIYMTFVGVLTNFKFTGNMIRF